MLASLLRSLLVLHNNEEKDLRWGGRSMLLLLLRFWFCSVRIRWLTRLSWRTRSRLTRGILPRLHLLSIRMLLCSKLLKLKLILLHLFGCQLLGNRIVSGCVSHISSACSLLETTVDNMRQDQFAIKSCYKWCLVLYLISLFTWADVYWGTLALW